jgi:hypothetical protein
LPIGPQGALRPVEVCHLKRTSAPRGRGAHPPATPHASTDPLSTRPSSSAATVEALSARGPGVPRETLALPITRATRRPLPRTAERLSATRSHCATSELRPIRSTRLAEGRQGKRGHWWPAESGKLLKSAGRWPRTSRYPDAPLGEGSDGGTGAGIAAARPAQATCRGATQGGTAQDGTAEGGITEAHNAAYIDLI